jgi:2-keto-4-pentenoate hydratase/2-oxohepta-3-ene-1,7-dioic acid hydratase in catechol pathway
MKIICIGRNYADHAKELGNKVPTKPLVFMKPGSALLVNNKPFYYPEFTKDLHYELELVLKISKNGRHIQPEFAKDYYQEISLGIDFTARDLQRQCKEKGHPWEIAKAFDHSAVIGKFVNIKSATADGHFEFYLNKNGEKVQHGFTKDLIFPFDDLIVYVSKFFKLQKGDYIYTGTPAGVGPVTIGDELEGVLVTPGGEKTLLNCAVK